jgi:hypothetical protein
MKALQAGSDWKRIDNLGKLKKTILIIANITHKVTQRNSII